MSVGSSHHTNASTPFRMRNRVWRANGGHPTDTPKPAAGSETLSKRGNKVWVSATLPGARRVSSHRSWKRKDKVWVSLAATPSQKKVTDEQQRGLRQQDFVVDKGGKRMRRMSSVPPTPLIKRALARLKGLQWRLHCDTTVTHYLCPFFSVCSRVVRKSLVHVWHARRQAHLKPASSQQCCTFYNRFGKVTFTNPNVIIFFLSPSPPPPTHVIPTLGKCTRGDKCPFIHDPERVAVCTKYVIYMCWQSA